MKKKVAFWRAGKYANYAWEQIKGSSIFNDQYIAFVDSKQELRGALFDSLKILSPQDLDKKKIEIYVIMSEVYKNEIKNHLINEMKIAEENVYLFDEYKRWCYARWKYKKDNLLLEDSKNNCFDIDNIVVYTAITGKYDELKEPEFQDENITYVCFTNNNKLKSQIWNIEYVHDNRLDNMYLAKTIKMYPQNYFKEYETSIWVDGKFSIQNDLRSYIRKYGKSKPILCFPHYERNCIYDEAIACLWLGKGNKEKIIGQISEYYNISYPFANGLYEMGCIVRQHNNDVVKKIMNDWYREIEKYSYRDQISFPVVCWKNNFIPNICDLYIEKNRWLKLHPHN